MGIEVSAPPPAPPEEELVLDPASGISAMQWLFVQTSLPAQVPNGRAWPQPFGTAPQVKPAGQVWSGMQPPHWLGTPPPPQVWPPVQVPQERTPPQPLGTMPQSLPAGHAV